MGYQYDLGNYSRAVTTASTQAQVWFDRGLNWTFGYNHEEAVRCFQNALEHDPDCAMAHWGVAYAAGPNYNMPWDLFDDKTRASALTCAYDATQAALALADRVTAPEAALIRALPARYPQRDMIEDQKPWDRAFADEMRKAYKSHTDDFEVACIFVESIMNITPWKMWNLETGFVADDAGTEEAQAVLERQLDTRDKAMAHPGLLHLYVHLMEMSPFPEKALKAADALRELVPDAGHLIHMPTHIDVLCGHYDKVVRWNQKAITADLKYLEAEGAFNIYTGYRQHNYHFVICGAMYLGQFAPAMDAVRDMAATSPPELLQIQSPPMADYFETIQGMEPHVLIRFGRWEEILQLELPEDRTIYCACTAFVEYAKGLALAALGHVEQAEEQRKKFMAAVNNVPESRLLHNVRTIDLLGIAEAMLDGEIAYRKGDYDQAFKFLRLAVERDDGLPYDEPWGWIQPARHALGALLFEQGRYEEAEVVYRQDLGLADGLSRASVHPDNVWSLKGLYDCLVRKDENSETRHIKMRLDLAMARADGPIAASCGCAQAAMAH